MRIEQRLKTWLRQPGKTGLSRIVYLGGLGEQDHEALSHHLKSRHEVERILQAGPVPVTNLRAAMILGSGSASFEMLRYLVDRLPMMITPRWVQTPCQPIAIGNVLDYLEGCLTVPETIGRTFDIGGPDVLTYRDIIQIYAREAGLRRRFIIPVPVLTPWLSARWVHLVTPVPAAIAQPLAEGLSIPVVCRDHRIRDLVPVNLMDTRQTIRKALDRIRQEQVDTCWFDGGGSLPPEWTTCGDADYAGGTVLGGAHRIVLAGDAKTVWSTVQAIGGKNGWYFAHGLWWLRGMHGPPGGWSRPAAGTPSSHRPARGRRTGFLAGHRRGTAPSPSASGGNEDAGGRPAGVCDCTRRPGQGGTEDGFALPAAWPGRHSLLVRPAAHAPVAV